MKKLNDNVIAKLILITTMLFSFAVTTVNAEEDDSESTMISDSRPSEAPAVDTSDASEDLEVSSDSSDEF